MQPVTAIAQQRSEVANLAANTTIWPEAVVLIGTGALEAMLMEAACAPAPGLVDRFNAGAHSDMDFFTFLRSSSALSLGMYRCAMAGWQHAGESPAVLPVLRRIGMEAEQAMFSATRGVNTQKGLLFLLGIVAAAAARSLRIHPQSGGASPSVLAETARICTGIVARELLPIRKKSLQRPLTAGERLYLQHGRTGVRGEIEQGLPVVAECGLPLFRQALQAGLSVNDAMVHALVGLMTETDDTTILHRHDLQTLSEVRLAAKSILMDGGMLTAKGRQRIQELDADFSRRRISPGGSADLLAVTYFLHYIETRN